MLIRSIMTPLRDLVTVNVDSTLEDAFSVIEKNGFLSIPVVDDKALAGFISKQFIYDSYFAQKDQTWTAFLGNPLKNYLHEKLEPVKESLFVEEAANIFFTSKIRFLPVVDEFGTFSGILTQKSLFGIIAHVYGLRDPKIVILLDDIKGALAKVADIISKNGGNITNVVNFDTEVMGLQELTIRLKTETPGEMDKIVEKLVDSGFKVKSVVK